MNRFKGATALVVDDSSTMRRLMDLVLGQLGIQVEFADCAFDALNLIKKRRYDLVFLDVILPDIDGYKVCKAIKGDKLTRNTPVIMLTSRDTAFDKVRGKMSGADTYLTKPLDRAVLLQTINKYLVTPHTMLAATANS
jgi:twitching motility two-component system response regulator PilG